MLTTINVIGRPFEINCDEGQEEYLQELAGEVDQRATELLHQVGRVGDARLLLLVSLSLVDELISVRQELAARPAVDLQATDETDEVLSLDLESLAKRVESIADRLEKA